MKTTNKSKQFYERHDTAELRQKDVSSRRHTQSNPSLVRKRGTSKTGTSQAHKTQKRSQKSPQNAIPRIHRNKNGKILRTRWQITLYSCPKQRTRGNMLFDPTERNVDPFQIPAGARTVKKLVLTSAIHDKTVTMAETAQVSLIIRTGPTPPAEDCGATKTHRNDELGITVLSKQRFPWKCSKGHTYWEQAPDQPTEHNP